MFLKIIITGILIFAGSASYCQSDNLKDSLKLDLAKLSARHGSGRLSDTAYMNQFNAAMKVALAEGTIVTNEELLHELSKFRAIAWGKEAYAPYKRIYYAILSNSAQTSGRGGEMLFYADKLEKLDSVSGKLPSLTALTIKVDFYKTRESFENVKELYAAEKKYLALLPSLVKDNKFTNKEALQAMICLEKFGEGIYKTKDKAAIDNIFHIMDTVGSIIKSRNPDNPVSNCYVTGCMASIISNKAIIENDISRRLFSFHLMDSLIKSPATPEDYLAYANQALMEAKITFYRQSGNSDSLKYWLDLYEKYPATGQDNDTKYFIESERAQQFLLKNNYAEGAQHLLKSIDLLQKSKTDILNDVDGILYAHAQAEDTKIELARSEEISRKKAGFVILALSLLASLIIILTAYFLRSRNALIKRIETLNKETKAQIDAIDELRQMSMWEEQQRISKEIHDNWLSELVSHIHNIDAISNDTQDEAVKPSLKKLQAQVVETYDSLRNLTHHLSNNQNEVDDDLFEIRIEKIADQALPDNKYNKSIHIGKGAMKYISLSKRIELLRIIQEAIANILKHASAKKVTILLYEDNGNIQLNITDNGKGFDYGKITRNKNMLGISSIEKRTALLGGVLNIESGKNGTSIQISFPAEDAVLFNN